MIEWVAKLWGVELKYDRWNDIKTYMSSTKRQSIVRLVTQSYLTVIAQFLTHTKKPPTNSGLQTHIISYTHRAHQPYANGRRFISDRPERDDARTPPK